MSFRHFLQLFLDILAFCLTKSSLFGDCSTLRSSGKTTNFFWSRIRLLWSDLFSKEGRHITLLVIFTDLGVCRTKLIDSADIYLSRGILGQVIHNIVTDILHCSKATQRYSADGIDTNVIEKSHGNRISNILKYFLRERRTVRIGINLWIRVSHRCLLLNAALPLYQLGCQRINPPPIMIITLQRITMRQPRSFLKSNATGPIPTHPVLVLNRHDLLREIALIHIKIQAIHCYQLGKSYVVGLALVLGQGISEDKDSLLGGVGVEVYICLQVAVLSSVLADGHLGCPDCWLVSPIRVIIEAVKVLAEGVESVVATGHAIWIQSRDDFENEVLSEKTSLLTF